MKFLVPNYSCLQNSCSPQIPVLSVLCQLNLLTPPKKKFLGTPLPWTKTIMEGRYLYLLPAHPLHKVYHRAPYLNYY
jgi:hypothetical protein